MRARCSKSALQRSCTSVLRIGSPLIFLGTSNFVPVQVKSSGMQAWDEILVESPLGVFVARRSVEWREGLPASLFFRPEYVDFFDRNNPSNNGTNTGTGVVERVTFLGNSADVVIRCGEI